MSPVDTSVITTNTGTAAVRIAPSSGFQSQAATMITTAEVMRATNGPNMCAKISPADISSVETMRESRPATGRANQPSGCLATWSPTSRWMLTRKSRATA